MSSSDKPTKEVKRSLSDFVRNATSAEKERVYQEVMKDAWERQEKIIDKARGS